MFDQSDGYLNMVIQRMSKLRLLSIKQRMGGGKTIVLKYIVRRYNACKPVSEPADKAGESHLGSNVPIEVFSVSLIQWQSF